jgi:hypothetical protein
MSELPVPLVGGDEARQPRDEGLLEREWKALALRREHECVCGTEEPPELGRRHEREQPHACGNAVRHPVGDRHELV